MIRDTAPPLSRTMSQIVTITLECGLTLVVEEIAGVRSVAMTWVLPAGAATDPAEQDGQAALLSELILRGAGGLSSREHSDALDRLGVNRGTDVSAHHMRIEGTMLGDRVEEALPLIASMITAPELPPEHLEAVRSLCLQSLEGLDDDPQHLAMLRLRERHLPPPFNRHGHGEPDALQRATIDELREAWRSRFKPRGSILGVAGAVNPHRLATQLNRLLKDWRGETFEPKPLSEPQRGYLPIMQQTAQVHIGLAWDAPDEADPTSMIERLGVNVLSGSTSGRLFTEVRQKRSLCYSVGASYRAGRDTGMISLYAGTTPERAQQTLDVCAEQIDLMRAGVTEDEFRRAVIGLKSAQVMQGESTPARAAALVYDQFRLGRARSLEEIAAEVDAITIERLNEHLAWREIGPFTTVSIGPSALETFSRAKPHASRAAAFGEPMTS
jgi:predicted Zn-dependent peptidase